MPMSLDRTSVSAGRAFATAVLFWVLAAPLAAQVMEIIDFVYRYRGAYLGFPTSVRRSGVETPHDGEAIPEGWIEFVPRAGGAVFAAGDLVSLMQGWGTCHPEEDCPLDLNDDGMVNIEDMWIVIQNWD